MTQAYTHKTLHTVHADGKIFKPGALMSLDAKQAAELEKLEAVVALTKDEIEEIEAREAVAARRAGKTEVDGLVVKPKPETKAEKTARLAAEKKAADDLAAGVVYKLDADGKKILDAEGNPIVDDGFGD